MKRYFMKVASLLFFLTVFIRCNKQLDLSPLGELNTQTFYQTEEDFDAASLSPYATLLTIYYSQIGQGWYRTALFPDDDATVSSNPEGADVIDDFNWLPSNGDFELVWQTCYKGIQRANVILDQLPKATQFKDVSHKMRYEAEAKFLRAYYYSILATNWGTPPVTDSIITSADQARLPNSAPGEIWDIIISDFTFAKANLPDHWDAANTGRATSGAATGLLGKALLFRAQWEGKPALYAQADAEFTSIINSGKYRLMDNFSDNFDVFNENNAESLFEIQFAVGRSNNWFPNEDGGGSGTGRYIMWRAACEQGHCAGGANDGHAYGKVNATKPLQNEFETGDPRRSASIFIEGDQFPSSETPVFSSQWSLTGSTPAKYIKKDLEGGANGEPNYDVNNERVLRYADILLMSAECKILGPTQDLAGAAALINQVRKRADPSETILVPRTVSTQAQMFKYLVHERRVELSFESHRYDDLVRWNLAKLINVKTDINFGRTAANANWNEKNLLKPIPQRELDLNANLKQNAGY